MERRIASDAKAFAAEEDVKRTKRIVILVALVLQNAIYTMLRKHSVATENVSSKLILMYSEVIKIVFSAYMVITSTESSDAKGVGIVKILNLLQHSYKMMVLSGIYLAMNVLSFVALKYIGAGEFTVFAQLKILTTASFSVAILHTKLSTTKWRALALLVIGCVLVSNPDELLLQSRGGGGSSQLLGYAAVLMEVILSGFASIYFEKVIKSTTEVVTIWERNLQLAFYSIIIYLAMLCYDRATETEQDREESTSFGLLAFSLVLLGALGGLLVAATLKYADAILKTLATAGAIVISTIFGHMFLGGMLNFSIALGVGATIIAILNYTFDGTAIVQYDKASCTGTELASGAKENAKI